MNPIVAGHEGIEAYEGLAVDLPAIEPDAADLIAIEADLFELVDDRLAELDVQVDTYGNVDGSPSDFSQLESPHREQA